MFLTRPVAHPIILCDDLCLDPATRRWTLAGVYPHFVLDAFPAVMMPFRVYVPFSGAQGVSQMQVVPDVSTATEVAVETPPPRVTGLDGKSRPARRDPAGTRERRRRVAEALAGVAAVGFVGP